MKKLLVIMIVIGLSSMERVSAQVEINGFTGWIPSAQTAYSYNGYRLRLEGAQNFGVGLGLNTPVGLVEFSYMGFTSTASQSGGIVIPGTNLPQDVNMGYYQLGVLKTLMEHDKFVPYGLFSLGWTSYNPQQEAENGASFSIALGLGMRYFFTDMIGVRLQARMLMPMYFGGLGIGCGVGTGGSSCGGGAYFGVEILQADFTGGIVLRINTQ